MAFFMRGFYTIGLGMCSMMCMLVRAVQGKPGMCPDCQEEWRHIDD